MSTSKHIPILKPFLHPVTNEPVLNVTKEQVEKFGIITNSDIKKYSNQLDKITLSDIIGKLFDVVPCKAPSLLLLYGDIIKSINKAKIDNADYIEMTKSECEQFRSIFKNTVIVKPEFNAFVLFLMESFDVFIENFDSLDPIDSTPEIKT